MEQTHIKLDYSLPTPEERTSLVAKIIVNTPSDKLTNRYLEKMADYIIFAAEKQERQQRKANKDTSKSEVLTDNRQSRINTREVSFEGLIGQLENGEDSVYNMITNDKNIIFQHATSITDEDRAAIPPLESLHQEIMKVEEALKKAKGKTAFRMRKQLIQMRQDQYIIKAAFLKPVNIKNIIKSFNKIVFDEEISLDGAESLPQSTGLLSFFKPEHISLLLSNYTKLKEDSYSELQSDAKWFLVDLEEYAEKALSRSPLLYSLLVYKIDGKTNAEIHDLLLAEFNKDYKPEYLSFLWKQKIPRLIAETATNEYLNWYYTFVEKGQWKLCNRCGEVKLIHPNFFNRNPSSKTGFYSICKCCRKKGGKHGIKN